MRNTSTRDKHRAAIRRSRPPCGLCGAEIDYTLPHLDPMSFVVDHIDPLAMGGQDTMANKQAAHRICNERKGATLPEEAKQMRPPRFFETERVW